MNGVEKAVWILKRLAQPPYSMTLAALSRELNMGRSGAYKILSVLKKNNLVAQDINSKQYRLGIAMHRMGNEFTNQLGIWDAAENILQELLRKTRETVSIGVLEGDTPFLAYRLVDSSYAHLALALGAKYPLHASAIGKCLAAYMDENHLWTLLKATPLLEKFTKHTITDIETLILQLRQIRKQGYAISNEEHLLGESAIAAPIKIGSKVEFSLSIGGVSTTFNTLMLKKNIPNVVQAAMRIAEKMTYKRA